MRRKKTAVLSGALLAGALLVTGVTLSAHPESGRGSATEVTRLTAAAETQAVVNLDDCPVLSNGYHGGCVSQLQTELNSFGNANLPVDGVFGPATEAAVTAFQEQEGISPIDGVVGSQTKAVLDTLSSGAVPTPELGSGDGSATPGATVNTINTPTYTVVRYVHPINGASCTANLVEAGITSAPALCTFLVDSANTYPPNNLSGAALDSFIASKNYRGYTNLPAYTVSCTNGEVTAANVAPGSAPFSWSLGYTRVNLGVDTQYPLAERYYGDSSYDLPSPTVTVSADKTSVQISFNAASRIATDERATNYTLSGYDAPFIWDDITETVGCDGTQSTEIRNTVFPTTDIYVNGNEVRYEKQSSDIAAFLEEGGSAYHSDGQGNLASPCHVAVFSGSVLQNSYDSC